MVNKLMAGLVGWMFTTNVAAQNYAGVTGKRDTSFTTYSAYTNTKKDHPFITMVGTLNLPSAKEKRFITYNANGHRSLMLDVFQPIKSVHQTAIIIVHGGGWRSGNRTQHHPLAQRLANFGYVCFTPEYRLSTEALFPAAVYDVKAAIRWVRSNADKYNIDPNRIVIAGFSAGGQLAAFMGATGNMPLFEGSNILPSIGSHVNAVVDIDGILSFDHPESGEGDDSKKTSASTYWFGYKKEEQPGLMRAASPLSWVGAKTPPTLFLNSSVARMHAGRDEYVQILNDHHVYSEVHSFKDAPHSFCLFEPWFTPTVNYIDAFLRKVFELGKIIK